MHSRSRLELRRNDRVKRSKQKKVLLILLVPAVAVLAFYAWSHRELLQSLSPSALRDFLLGWGFWKGAVLYFLIYSFGIRPFVPIPPTLLTLASGLTFGPLMGTVLTVLGATTNACITYALGKFLGEDWVKKHVHGRTRAALIKLSEGGFRAILLVRLSPVGPPYDAVSYAAGLLGIDFLKFFWATLLGIIPATAAYCYFGGSLVKGIKGVLVAIFGLVLVAVVLPWAWKRWDESRKVKSA